MRSIAVFTSNQPRHIALVERLSALAETVYVVQECTTVFPSRVESPFAEKGPRQRYFERMTAAEAALFGEPRFGPGNAHHLALARGDLSAVEPGRIAPALDADVTVVFGASYIKRPLVGLLVERRAINLHMGLSPYYRGSASNFWALYDRRPEMVGATAHLLSEGLDTGDVLFHALPPPRVLDPFLLGMKAVESAFDGLARFLRSGELDRATPVPQDGNLELRYSRQRDFTDDVAREYLEDLPTGSDIAAALSSREPDGLVRPYVPGAAA